MVFSQPVSCCKELMCSESSKTPGLGGARSAFSSQGLGSKSLNLMGFSGWAVGGAVALYMQPLGLGYLPSPEGG